MKLIFAQGNPGKDYEKTRHNVGFMALDFYADKKSVHFQPKAKFAADVAELNVGKEKVLLIKPKTFYNETGKAARALVDFYKLDPADIMVVHDELSLPFGTLRTREKGSDGGNNGIKSLNAHLSENYARLRIGTHNEIADQQGATDFVLSKFSGDETKKLKKVVMPKVCELIDDFIDGKHQSSSHSL